MSSAAANSCRDVQQCYSTTYNCVVCPGKFSLRKSLYAHLRRVHNYQEGDLSNSKTPYEVCELCEMVFTNVMEHKKVVHGITVEDKKNLQRLCPICGILFSTEVTMKNHQLRIHSKLGHGDQLSDGGKYSKPYKSRIKCPECKDDHHLKTYSNLRNHLTSDHNIEIKYEELHFDSFEEFEKWKGEYEDNHYVLYSKDCSPKPGNKLGKRYLYYNCHRSYSYRAKNKSSKIQKVMGSNKTGTACPSHIKVIIEKNNSCLVHFWKTHVGHVAEIQRCKLRKDVRAEIAAKIQQGVPIQKILDQTRNSLVKGRVMQRVHLLTKKDIYNISRDYKVPYNREDDVSDTDLTGWVTKMCEQTESPIVYFKNVGDKTETLSKDDFAIILIVPSQIPQLEKFGNKVICVDQIQYDASCEVNLYIIMTVDDEFGLACAVAFCFSNRSDEIILQLFFEQIRSRLGQIKTSIFISDLNPASYNSWSLIMSEVPHRFWSKWHIAQDLGVQAELVIKQQKKVEQVVKALKVLQETDNIDAFQDMLDCILNDFCGDPDLTDFSDYLIDYYVKFTDFWGSCYRQDLLGIDAHLQSLHTVYERVCSRLSKHDHFVKAIETVLKIARDNYFQHIVKVCTNTPNKDKFSQATDFQHKNGAETNKYLEETCLQLAENGTTAMGKPLLGQLQTDPTLSDILSKIKESHYKSELITSEMIVTLKNDIEWIVFSSEHLKQIDYVVKINLLCRDCDIRCSKCDICIHNFKCSCVDYAKSVNTICSHIHACASLFKKSQQADKFFYLEKHEDAEILNSCNSDIFEIEYVQEDANDSKKSFLDELKYKANLILSLSEQIAVNATDQINVLNKMDEIISVFDAA